MSLSNKLIRIWAIIIPSLVLFYVSLWLTVLIRYPHGLTIEETRTHITAFGIIYLAWLVVLFIHNLFELQTLSRYRTLLTNLISAMAVNAVIAVLYFYLQPNLILTPRRFLLIDVVLSFILLASWYTLLRYVLQKRLTLTLYLFSLTDELSEFEGFLQKNPLLGYGVPKRLTEQDLEHIQLSQNSVVVLPDNLYVNPSAVPLLYRLRLRAVRFYNHRAFFEQLFRRIYLADVDELWFLHNIDYKRRLIYDFWKRILDIVASLIGLVVFIVSFPLLAALIKLTSEGPIFFTQKRVGKDGKLFIVYKYRTMTGGVSNTWTEVGDPRVTKLGRFFRKSRLDELPQFINVFRGTMSLVGPRPEQPHLVEALRSQIPFYDERHLVKPGITGWAQLHVYAGNVEETKLKLQYDLYYIKHRSFLFDLEIILKTTYYILTWSGR